MTDPEERLRIALDEVSALIDGNQLEGEHVARAKMIETVIDGLRQEVRRERGPVR